MLCASNLARKDKVLREGEVFAAKIWWVSPDCCLLWLPLGWSHADAAKVKWMKPICPEASSTLGWQAHQIAAAMGSSLLTNLPFQDLGCNLQVWPQTLGCPKFQGRSYSVSLQTENTLSTSKWLKVVYDWPLLQMHCGRKRSHLSSQPSPN